MVTDTAGNISITALLQDSRGNRQPDSHSDFRGVKHNVRGGITGLGKHPGKRCSSKRSDEQELGENEDYRLKKV